MKKIFIRSGVIVFWITLIFSVLYFPNWNPFEGNERSLNVFCWGNILQNSVIADFEQKTGIKVHLNYYSSNEELIVKMKATKGKGYDLIIPSDYAVQILAKESLLKEIDKTQLFFWNHINPLLLNHFYDLDNHFSIPFEWEIYGMGINKDYFQNKVLDPSWNLIFSPPEYKISMINDPIEAVLFAGFYLYGPLDALNPIQAEAVKKLLVQQRSWVEAYSDFRTDYFLATKNCPVVLSSSSYIWQALNKLNFVDFIVPKEGTFITIENLCIPEKSKKEQLAYQLINHLMQPESIAIHYKRYGFFPSTLHALDTLNLSPKQEELIRSSTEDFKKYHFTEVLIPEQQIRDIWVEVKS